jgi:glucose-6-phosphate-specific signal transduction histidine kinase
MHKKERGLLHIRIASDNGHIHIVIQDNGIGRKQSALQQNSESGIQKSFGTQITHDRIALIRQSLNIEAEVHIEDLYDERGAATGTRVHLTLPQINPRGAQRMINQGVSSQS